MINSRNERQSRGMTVRGPGSTEKTSRVGSVNSLGKLDNIGTGCSPTKTNFNQIKQQVTEELKQAKRDKRDSTQINIDDVDEMTRCMLHISLTQDGYKVQTLNNRLLVSNIITR